MTENCCVCGESIDPENVARCIRCGRQFHLAWSTQTSVRDCGHYWIDDRACALVFVCALCLESHA